MKMPDHYNKRQETITQGYEKIWCMFDMIIFSSYLFSNPFFLLLFTNNPPDHVNEK